jgi:hypothetical protein
MAKEGFANVFNLVMILENQCVSRCVYIQKEANRLTIDW